MNTNVLVVDTTTSNTSYTASLGAGTPYRWNVAACNSTGCSSYTTVLYFQTPVTASLPSAPQNLSASPGNGQVGLGWNAPASNGGASITSYRVFRGTNSSNTLIVTSGGCASLGAVLGCTDTGLTNGQSYYYIVSAVNSAGQGPPSNGATATPTAPVTVPATPLNPSPGSTSSPGPMQGSTSVALSWSASNTATYYSLGVRDMNTNGLVVDTTTANTSYTASLSANTPYRWNVAACNSAGCSSFTTVLYFQTPVTASLPSAPQNL
ncbi:MAG: fibronectin type III domain-containing protein, partial [Acidobacteriota bacterium]